MVLDTIATGSGVLVIRQPQHVTVVTDLAGVWPVFYATVARSLIFSSSAESVAALVGREVNGQWLAVRLLAGSVPGTWSEGSPYRHVRAVPGGGVLLVSSAARPVVVYRELPLAAVEFAEGAQRLAGALSTAVHARTQAYRDISMDLSGGAGLLDCGHARRCWPAQADAASDHIGIRGTGQRRSGVRPPSRRCGPGPRAP